jgi:hypothetical protein
VGWYADKFLCVFQTLSSVRVAVVSKGRDVRVWKFHCLSSLGMDTVYNSAIIVVYRLEILT